MLVIKRQTKLAKLYLQSLSVNHYKELFILLFIITLCYSSQRVIVLCTSVIGIIPALSTTFCPICCVRKKHKPLASPSRDSDIITYSGRQNG